MIYNYSSADFFLSDPVFHVGPLKRKHEVCTGSFRNSGTVAGRARNKLHTATALHCSKPRCFGLCYTASAGQTGLPLRGLTEKGLAASSASRREGSPHLLI